MANRSTIKQYPRKKPLKPRQFDKRADLSKADSLYRPRLGRTLRNFFCLVLGCFSGANALFAESIALIDDSHQTVRLARPARRIVSMTPHITETLLAIGLKDQIVAVLSGDPCRPSHAKVIGNGYSVDLETLASLRPDLIIAWGSGSHQTIEKLRQTTIPLFITDPRKLTDIPRALEQMGRLTGRSQTAAILAASLKKRISALQTTYGSRSPVRVFFQVWISPIITIGRSSIIDDAITLCGGRSIFQDQLPASIVVDLESVLMRDPELIVAAVFPEQRDELLGQWSRHPWLAAVRHRQIQTIDNDRLGRPSPAFILATEKLCRIIDRTRKRGD